MKRIWRLLNRNRFYSFVSIIGLSVSLAFCVLVTLLTLNEFSYDSTYQDADRLFRVLTRKRLADGRTLRTSNQPFPLAPAMLAEVPEITAAPRWSTSVGFVANGDRVFHERLHFADASAIALLDMRFLLGDSHSALIEPLSIVVTRSTAQKYFGDEDILGRVLTISTSNSRTDFLVSGVVVDMPANSSFVFDFLMPFTQHPMYSVLQESWNRDDPGCSIIVRLRDSADPKSLDSKLEVFVERHLGGVISDGQKTFRLSQQRDALAIELQSVKRIRLDPDVHPSQETTTSLGRIYVLIAIALLVLSIACANFVVLTFAQSISRAKEIGLRKVFGSPSSAIALLFWQEALVICSISEMVAIILAFAIEPFFSELISQKITFEGLPGALFILGALIAVLSGIAGLLPGFILSRPNVSDILKRRPLLHSNGLLTRTLLVCQLAITAVLTTVSLVMWNQLTFILSKDLGYRPDHVVSISLNGISLQKRDLVVRELEGRLTTHPSILSISASSGTFELNFKHLGESKGAFFSRVTHGFPSVLGLEFVQGRDFDRTRSFDAVSGVIVNEAFLRMMNWQRGIPESHQFERWYKNQRGFEIIGVVKDYHFQSLREEIRPLALFLDDIWPESVILVRFGEKNSDAEVLDLIKREWGAAVPNVPLMATFLVEDVERQYEEDEHLLLIVGCSSVLSIGMSTYGLMAIVIFSLNRRTKEIGIRKVLGASVFKIVKLLAAEFLGLVLAANLIGLPLGAYLANQWLLRFPHRVSAEVLVFVLAGLIGGVVVLSLVLLHARKAALSNPVDSLRYE